jgi:two-component system sensor histidine kinase DctS
MHKLRGVKPARLAVGIAGAAVLGGVIYLAGALTVQREITRQEEVLHRSIEIHSLALRGTAAKYNYLPFTVSQHTAILAVLLSPTDESLQQTANNYLEEVNRRAGSQALYVMDKSGQTLVASNWNTPQSFINNNYANRPYAIDALKGQSGLFYGVGKTTGEPGLFISVPMRQGGEVVGLVAVKVDLRQIQETWATAPDPIMLADAKGLFFLGSVASWMYKSNKDLTAEDLDWLIRHEVYGKLKEFQRLPWVTERIDGPGYLLRTRMDENEKTYLAISESLPEFGWTLTVTSDYASVIQARNRAWVVSSMACALLLLGGLFWQLRKRQLNQLETLVQDRTRDLNEAHAFRKSMEDSLLVGMRARDLEGHIIYVNPALCDMTGYSAQELLGRLPPYPYWHSEDIDMHWQNNSAAMSGQAALTGFESRIRHRSGRDVYTMVYTAPLIDAAGKHTGWMSSVVDITAQKLMEDKQRQQDEHLQHVQRREIMNEMASTLAHEISQPLMAIGANTGAAKVFAEQGDMPSMLATLDKIAQQKKRAADIVKAIMDRARKATRGTEDCDMNRIVDCACEFLGAEFKHRKAKLQRQLQQNLPLIHGDRVLLEQVLVNLMVNGLHAMQENPTHQRTIDIETELLDGAVHVRVGDNGPGISPEVGEQIFKHFVTTKKDGLGIGLSICRTIIETHGGRLTFNNRPQRGVVFSFSLPCKP